MQWLTRIFICGRPNKLVNIKKDQNLGMIQNGLVSEITQAGELGPGESVFRPNQGSVFRIDEDSVRILLRKQEGDLLGMKLFRSSLEVQSIEDNSVLSSFRSDLPIGCQISSINGVVPTTQSVKQLLRECRDLSTVLLVFSRPSTHRTRTIERISSTKRLSHSSSSSMGYSPTPSQLSNMWRRVSETGSQPMPMPDHNTDGVTAIDFTKLSRSSMNMWTRNTSLPARHEDQRLTFEEEFTESPSFLQAIKVSRNTASRSSLPN